MQVIPQQLVEGMDANHSIAGCVLTRPQDLQPKITAPLLSSPFWCYASKQYIGVWFFLFVSFFLLPQHQELRNKFIKIETVH